MRLSFFLGLAILLATAFVLTGCAEAPPGQAAPPPPVTVSVPLKRMVTEYAVFTGRTAAVKSVELRARVFGYLNKVNFKEGAEVKEGDILFEIDPSTYKADLDMARARSAEAMAQLKFYGADYERNRELLRTKSLSPLDVEKSLAQRDTAQASLDTARAEVERRKLDYEFTKVRAPISGQVSRAEVTEGNLIQSGQTGGTLLTTIVSLDPMYAYFDGDEFTLLRVRKMRREGKFNTSLDPSVAASTWGLLANPPDQGPLPAVSVLFPDRVSVPIDLELADEKGFPHKGWVDFVDNQVNRSTGTISVRGKFDNKKRALMPGMFVRVRLPIGEPHDCLLVNERALVTEQGQKVLYLVNDKNEVVSQPVEVGPLQEGLRVITSGLKRTDRVIVNGLQRVRPGVTVTPKLAPMPELPGTDPGTAKNKAVVRSSKSTKGSN